QESLNLVWEVKLKGDQGVLLVIRSRLLAFALILGLGSLLLAYLLVSVLVAALSPLIVERLPESLPTVWAIRAGEFVLTLVVITVFFAIIYKILPAVQIAWRDVWVGAAVTSLLFSIGKVIIGFYLGQSAVGSAYGAAGSIVIILLWFYFSTQIFLFGAEFTQVYANRYGSKIVPAAYARALDVAIEALEQEAPRPPEAVSLAPIPPPPADSPPAASRAWLKTIAAIAVSFLAGLLVGLLRLARVRKRGES
ncbi:MAG: YihY/virulence factor BrkB family protein, partial [Chloroflexi bacterium]|nr:YihY/virulence factor BrkB family protein [Chloroflexota bacterium]